MRDGSSVIIGVGNAQKIQAVALQFSHRVNHVAALQRDVLRPAPP